MRHPFQLFILMVALVSFANVAEARKFGFESESFSTFFGGTFGLSQVHDSPYGDANGSGVTVSQNVMTNASGEFGVLLSLRWFNLKIGGELIIPRAVAGASGKNASDTEYFTLDSKSMAVTPSAYLEFPFRKTSTSRALLGLGFGWATVSLDNTYTFTTAGLAAYPGVADYVESASGMAGIYTGYFGYEMLFTDTTTVFFNLGYRSGLVKSFASTKTTTAITGSQVPGTELLNSDGSRRTMDLSGGFIGLSFRFYL